MAAHSITLSDDALIGEYLPLDDLKGILEQRVAIAPDLMAMIIRNGEVVSASAGGNIGVGGLWRSVKDAVVGRSSLRLLIADLKPFPLITGLDGVSRDNVPVAGEIIMEFQVNPEAPSGVIGLMQEHSAVYKAEVMNRLAPHLGDRVIQNVIGQMDAADLRGNNDVQDKIQAEVMHAVERIAGDMSLMVRSVSVRWALNDEEIAAIEARDAARERERADIRLATLQSDLKRENEATVFQLGTELDLEKAKAASEDELRSMVLNQELAFNDARDTGMRIQTMKALEGEIEQMNLERVAKFNAEIAGAEHEVDRVNLRAALRKVEREIEDADTRQRVTLRALEQQQEDERARRIRDDQIKDKAALEDIEDRADDRKARRERDAKAQADQAELEMLRLKAQMSPDVLLAINAGASPEVAHILVEQARASAGDNAEKMALIRENLDLMKQNNVQTADQARHALETAMQGAVGVAQGAGPGAAAPTDTNDMACPDCGRAVTASDKFCRGCGRQMRA